MHPDTNTAWLVWNDSTAITESSAITIGTVLASASTSVVAFTDAYWRTWIVEQEETAEQRAERGRRQAVADARARDLAAVRQAAMERAERLLEACLSLAQRDQFQSEGWFLVRSPSGRRYQIRRGRARNVIEVNMQGRRLRTLCCHPVDGVPDADTMLAQKLMLETQEDEFLRLANVS